MSTPSKTYGSYGLRQFEDVAADQRKVLFPAGQTNKVARPVFGKRTTPPTAKVSLASKRLLNLYSELLTTFEDLAFSSETLPFAFLDGDVPHVHVAPAGIVRLDEDTGSYVFSDETAGTSSILITTSHDRLLDAILSHLAEASDALAPEFAAATIARCVGHTIGQVERSLILATLRHCNGNRTHAARTLGISLRTLRNKLHTYWRSAAAVLAENNTRQQAMEEHRATS